ncbi:MAG: DUF1835 domain-containing protein [Chloracidobacterium sp.]|nr:DUF1835 domain-containing protein [Chloracidobacterium sp.]
MIYHVLPGDSLVEEFRKSEIDGDVIVCRECMIVGDVSGETLDELFEHRSHFLLIEYGTDEIDYHEQVADELSRLVDLPDGTIVNLWFEYELFCQVNLWFCLYLLSGTEATIYRVAPSERNSDEVWKGFGGMDERPLSDATISGLNVRPPTSNSVKTFGRLIRERITSDFDNWVNRPRHVFQCLLKSSRLRSKRMYAPPRSYAKYGVAV